MEVNLWRLLLQHEKKQPREWQVKITLKIHGTSLPSEVRRFFHPMDFCNLKPVEFLDSGILHAVPSTTSLYRPFGRCKIPLKTLRGDLCQIPVSEFGSVLHYCTAHVILLQKI